MTIRSDRISLSTVALYVAGRLDTATAPLFERKLKQWGDDITEIILDFSGLNYISSMGLRVLLQAQRVMKEKDRKLVIQNMDESIREVFEMTGFINLMVQDEKFVIIRKDESDQIRLSLIGQMEAEDVPSLEAELNKIKEAAQKEADQKEDGQDEGDQEETVSVVLDVEKLSSLSAPACHALREAIDETAWETRKLSIQNVPQEMKSVFAAEGGMDNLLPEKN